MKKEIIKELVKNLKEDKDYYQSWKANIAMAFYDNYMWYKKKTNKKTISKKDIPIIANNSAKSFLDLLIK